MSYRLYKFGDTQLFPTAQSVHDIGTGEARIDAMDLPTGGAFDQRGREQSPIKSRNISVSAILIGTSAADLVSKFDALRAYTGKRDKLWRINDSGVYHWVWARLTSVDTERAVENRLHIKVNLTFFIYSPVWNGNLIGTWRLDTGLMLDDGLFLDAGVTAELGTTSKTLTITNGGNVRLRAIEMAITAKTTSITSVIIEKAGETYITWNGTVLPNTQLVFDFGALSVRNNGIEAYSGMILSEANHKIDNWLNIDPGDNTVKITQTGGGATSEVAFTYYDGWI